MTGDSWVRRIAWGRLLWAAASLAIASALTWKFSHLLSNETDLIGVIATIFSILAATLIAIISILGDPSMLMDKSWRHSYLSAAETQRRLHRKSDIFLVY